MSSYVLGFQDIDKTKPTVVGGKGANLGELSKIEGIRVPDGFCISTEAFKRIMGETSSINELLDKLSLLKVEDRDKIGELSGEFLGWMRIQHLCKLNANDPLSRRERKQKRSLYPSAGKNFPVKGGLC
jgi:phosphoenolpyruvate synthase/pyruvate phosphate dikinase